MPEEKTDWILPNRFIFTKWVYQKFHPSRYISDKKKYFEPDPSQKLIRDYMSYDSPYRGILVYHGLGTGKTCTAILASDTKYKKVVVLLPASLENNYRKELSKCSMTGSMLKSKWSLIKFDLKTELPLIKKIISRIDIDLEFFREKKGIIWLPDRIIKDISEEQREVSGLLHKNAEDKDKKAIEDVYWHVIDKRYTFLHYNGLSNKKLDQLEKKNDFGEDIFDNSIVVIDEVHTFISGVVNGSQISRRLYNLLLGKENVRFILLSGTPVINHPFELCYTLNLLRGAMKEYTIRSTKDITLPDVPEIIDYLHQNGLYKFIDTLDLSPSKTEILIRLMPKSFVRVSKISNNIVKGESYKDEDTFIKNKLLPILQKKYALGSKIKTKEYSALPDKRERFMEEFFDMSDSENPIVRQETQELFMRRVQGIVSYYRISDEKMFPKMLETLYVNVPMSDYQFKYYIKKRLEEIKQEDVKKNREGRNRNRGAQADLFKTNSSYKAYSRMCSNFAFPIDIIRPFPKDIKLKLIRKEIDIHEEDEDVDVEVEEVTKKDTLAPDVNKIYDSDLKEALAKLSKSDYLNMDNLEDFSPKMHRLLNDLILNRFAKSLLYSQFRTVEGIRIFKMVLDNAGWKEIDFKQEAGEWKIINASEVLSEKYDNKRYLIFGNKQKTDLLINLFNADFKNLPMTIKRQLEKSKQTENLRGKIASLLMITQSGAEGLNLRNVRFVYILEPFWNQVRIDQVIGRAIRKRSHLELPEDERNVQVVMYISTFTEEQADMNKTIKLKDKGRTTDQDVFAIATRKNSLIQQFLSMLKSTAIDCVFHAAENKPLLHNYKCYMPPRNVDDNKLAYIPNIEDDKKSLSSFSVKIRSKKIKGNVVSYNGVKHVMLENDPILYDYHAYKEGGVLVDSLVL